MKITDLQLERYGIYRDVSWEPPQNQLIVVMGENESGKTTLLNFIRDMLFGYRRGMWQDRSGNMGFLRGDGEFFRVYRHGKESWFADGRGIRYTEELPLLWWHGLNRSMYEKIFAVGLEDLQGAGFLAQDDVRSRFFMLQGGDILAEAKKTLTERMEKLLLPSAQGKRRINQILEKLDQANMEIGQLSLQEEHFAELQKAQADCQKEIKEITARLVAEKEEFRILEKKIGAWKYYVRAREIKRQLLLGEQVKMFPKDGKEQWNQLMSRMELLHDQKTQLQEKLNSYTPKTKEEVIPWTEASEALEQLYKDLGQWSRTIEETDELRRRKQMWRADFAHLGYKLPLWDRMISPDEEFPAVNWDEGRKLAQGVTIRDNELHFWKQREPEVEDLEINEETSQKEAEEEWNAFEEKASRAEALLHKKTDLQEELEELAQKETSGRTVWFWISAVSGLGAVGGAAAFYLSFAGFAALYAAGGCFLAAVAAFLLNGKSARKKEKQLKRLQEELAAVNLENETLKQGFPLPLPESLDDLPVFHNALQQKRTEFYREQAKLQALSWKQESMKRQKKEHEKWEAEGEALKKSGGEARSAWTGWLQRNHLPQVEADQLSTLQEEWQKLYAEQGAGKILDVRIEKAQERLDSFVRRALSIIRMTGAALEASPETIADIYEENRKRLLLWQAIAEKNNQHEEYQKEMEQLDLQWTACQEKMQKLLSLVNAGNAEEFAERITASEQHDQLEKEWESVKKSIRLYAGNEPEFQKLWAALESGDYDEWTNSHKTLQEGIEADERRLSELQKQQGATENEIYRLANDERITGALQDRESAESELRQAMEEWLTGLYAVHFLQEAQQQYEVGKQPQIVEEANRFLQAMTGDRYRLEVSEDGKSVCTVDQMKNRKDAKLWSSGTGDQVYLALRLAMALAFSRQMESLPIVLDDIFVRFDEKRQRETVRFLLELGKRHQIFLFTCHERTFKLAEEEGRSLGAGAFFRLTSGQIAPVGAEA